MRIKTVFFALFLNFSAFAEQTKSPLTEIKVNRGRSPYLLNLILDKVTKNPNLPKRVYSDLHTNLSGINRNLRNLEKNGVFFFIQSEFYKLVLNYQPDIKVREYQISHSHIINLKEKLKKNDLIYSDLSKLIINNIISDYESYMRDNFLNNYQNRTSKASKMFHRVNKLKKMNKYLAPWIEITEKKSPGYFNTHVTRLAINFFSILNQKSEIYFMQKPLKPLAYEDIFQNLDNPELLNYLNQKNSVQAEDLNLENQQDKAKKEAEQSIESISPTKIEKATKELDNLIEDIDADKQ